MWGRVVHVDWAEPEEDGVVNLKYGHEHEADKEINNNDSSCTITPSKHGSTHGGFIRKGRYFIPFGRVPPPSGNTTPRAQTPAPRSHPDGGFKNNNNNNGGFTKGPFFDRNNNSTYKYTPPLHNTRPNQNRFAQEACSGSFFDANMNLYIPPLISPAPMNLNMDPNMNFPMDFYLGQCDAPAFNGNNPFGFAQFYDPALFFNNCASAASIHPLPPLLNLDMKTEGFSYYLA